MAHVSIEKWIIFKIYSPLQQSPTHEYNPREDVLNQIRIAWKTGKEEMPELRQFMNQFPGEQMQEQGAVGADPRGYPALQSLKELSTWKSSRMCNQ